MRLSPITIFVTPGLDPGVHAAVAARMSGGMDCRVEPGNDDLERLR